MPAVRPGAPAPQRARRRDRTLPSNARRSPGRARPATRRRRKADPPFDARRPPRAPARPDPAPGAAAARPESAGPPSPIPAVELRRAGRERLALAAPDHELAPDRHAVGALACERPRLDPAGRDLLRAGRQPLRLDRPRAGREVVDHPQHVAPTGGSSSMIDSGLAGLAGLPELPTSTSWPSTRR